MIRQLCPHCLTAVELPADAAGTAPPCPKCGQPIPVPAGYTPTVTPEPAPMPDPAPPPAPPPGFVPPRPAAAEAPRPAADADPTGVVPGWAGWLPAVGLTAALLASFFPWVGSYPGGVRVYTQTPWQAAVGTFATAILPDGLTDDEGGLRQAVRASWWLLPYLPLLLLGVALAWAERLVPSPAPALPPRAAWLGRLWPHRYVLLLGLTVLTLLLVAVQTWQGYGLELAAREIADAKFAKQAEEAVGNQNRLTWVRVKAGYEANRLGVQGATALDLTLLAHLLATAGAAGGWWLHRRGDRPLPRLALVR